LIQFADQLPAQVAITNGYSQMPLDVVVLNDAAHVNGGAAAVAVQSAVGLAQAGFRVTFIAAQGPIASELEGSNVQVVLARVSDSNHGPTSNLILRRLWNVSAGKVTARVLEGRDRHNCVVHAHNWHGALSASAPGTALQRGFEVICTLHDYNIACPTGSFFDQKSARICPLTPLSAKCVVRACTGNSASKALEVLRQLIQIRSGIPRKIRHFVTVSEFSESILRTYFGPEASVYRVSNPLDVSRGRPVDVAHNQIFSMIARLDRAKGVTLFAEATRRGDFKCCFVGDGRCRSEILRENPSAEVTGWLPLKEVRDQLSRTRCLVLPSIWYEAQPLCVLEASAMGVPSIVSDICASREQIEDGITGFLFRTGDVDSLVAGLRRLEDDNLVARLGRNAFERFWADPPTIERHVQALAAVYEKVLARRGEPVV
jgi:glycosyltransferase involved in cell wall biosynthesis